MQRAKSSGTSGAARCFRCYLRRPQGVKTTRHRKSGSAYAGELDAKTGEHPRPADAALPLHTVGDRPVTINPWRTIQIDTMLDRAKIVVDNDQRSAQRRQVARIPRLDTFKPLALAGVAHRAQLAAHRISVAVWHWREPCKVCV